jgi:hypothetical protein
LEEERVGAGREVAGAGRFVAGAIVARAADRPEPAFLAFACGRVLAFGLAFTVAFAFAVALRRALGLGT